MAEKSYKVYRGLQKPFSLFGLKGVNVIWGAVGVIGSILLFFIVKIIFGNFLIGLLTALILAGFCAYKIFYHMKYGLRSKKWHKGIWMVKNLVKPTFFV